MHVSQSRHVRTALAAAALIATTGATVTGVGTASAEPAAGILAAPAPATVDTVRYQSAGDLFAALQFPTIPGVASVVDAVTGSTESVESTPEPAAEPAPSPAPEPGITADELSRIVPQVAADKLAAYIQPLNDAMAHGGIDTPVRQAAFISQLAVESDSFRTFEEYASGRAYEGRSDLGNTQPGDGERYKGRGAIQVTGRHNYEEVSRYTGIDFVAHPELMSAPENAFSTAVWYWTSRNLNAVADGAGIVRVSELVNGGHHGLAERLAGFARGLDVLTHP